MLLYKGHAVMCKKEIVKTIALSDNSPDFLVSWVHGCFGSFLSQIEYFLHRLNRFFQNNSALFLFPAAMKDQNHRSVCRDPTRIAVIAALFGLYVVGGASCGFERFIHYSAVPIFRFSI